MKLTTPQMRPGDFKMVNIYNIFVFIQVVLFPGTFLMASVKASSCIRQADNSFLQNGRRLSGHVYTSIHILGVVRCAKICYAATKCKSFNYQKGKALCELSDEDTTGGNVSIENDFIFGNSFDVPQTVSGACTGHTCLPAETCLPLSSGYKCLPTEGEVEVNCGPPPAVDGTSVVYDSTTTSDTALYKCTPPSLKYSGLDIINCTNSAVWTTQGIQCRNIEIYTSRMTQADGKTTCESHGGNLLTITSSEDMAVVTDFLETNNVIEHVWIGLEYDMSRGDFVWSNGRDFDNEDVWGDNDPDDPVNKPCIVKRRDSRALDDKSCSELYYTLCSLF
ncbi:aggrecan core protein [Patella vulgata]|uniref:aggrecan core protein n=1 Tax=Patella vulgata TaxID=6465 RepID=UPI0021801BC9|nr:aggrecan core protein [Patella vulgata]